jgi:hypothetical protein
MTHISHPLPFIISWWKEKKEFWVFYFHRLVPFLLFFSFSKIKSRPIATTWRRTGWYVRVDGCRKRDARKPRWTSSTTWTPKWRTTRDSTNFKNPILIGKLTQP